MPNPKRVASGVLVVFGSLAAGSFAATGWLLPADALPLVGPPSAASTVQLTGYGGDGSGAHRHGHRRATTSRTPDAAVPDLHGATRDDADKAYRKKYGF